MSCIRNSSLSDKCVTVTTTNCVSFQGDDYACEGNFRICTGDSLTEVINDLILTTCSNATGLNMTDVVIPDCYTTYWTGKNKTVFNFIDFLITTVCSQEKEIQQVNDLLATNDPVIELDYPCCSDTCIPGETLPVSQHLQKIILCVCGLSSTLSENSDALVALNALIQAQALTISTLNTTVTSLITQNTSLQSQLNTAKDDITCLKSAVVDLGGTSC